MAVYPFQNHVDLTSSNTNQQNLSLSIWLKLAYAVYRRLFRLCYIWFQNRIQTIGDHVEIIRLNSVTVSDRYLIPHIKNFSSQLHGWNIISKIDLIRVYHQISVAESDIHKTFWTL